MKTRSQTQQLVSLNWFLFGGENTGTSSEIDVPASMFCADAEGCQEFFAKKILEQYRCSVETKSIEFWTPKADLSVNTLINKEWIKTNGDIKVLARPISLVQSLSVGLGDKEKNREIIHLIVTAEKKTIRLNWVFLNQKHPHTQVRYINVPQSSSFQDYRKTFADEISTEFEFPVEIESIRFWTPKEHLPINTYMKMKTSHDVMVFANPVALTHSFPSALAEKLNDATIVHIVVTTAEEEEKEKPKSTKADDKNQPLPESLRFDLTVKTAKGKTTLEGARAADYVRTQRKEEETIYDGRHSALTFDYTAAPPIEIYHRIFNTFLRLVEDPPQPTADDLNDTYQLMQYLCELSDGGQIRSNKTVLYMLYKILEQNPGRTDEMFLSNQVCVWAGNEWSIPILIVELKEELGEGNYDPSIQAGLSMKHFWSMDNVKEAREKCCCPTFLLSGGGPWIGIMGAVFTDRVIVQRLTDIRWFGISTPAEDKRLWANTCILLALREALKQLTRFYKNDLYGIKPWVPHGPHPRFYPYPISYPYISADGTHREIKFEYQRALDKHSGCVTFLARTLEENPEDIVVKYVTRYGGKAHKFLADLNYAPKLFYHGPLPDTPSFEPISNAAQKAHPGLLLRPDTMHMVVMEYIESEVEIELFRSQLEKILFKLHEEGYAFGDFRLQNILKDSEGNFKLIDFNWCGEYDTKAERDWNRLRVSQYVRNKLQELDKRERRATTGPFAYYPTSLSLLPNEWPWGVGPLKPVLPEHDWALLEKIFLGKLYAPAF